MLVIRAEQMQVFEQVAERSFEDEMLAHLSAFSPSLARVAGADKMREAIRLGMAQADTHGFTLRGPVRFYLELMLMFGSHFDTDPQYPWIAELLTDRDFGSEMQRADRLHERVIEYRAQVAGPNDRFFRQALQAAAMVGKMPLNLPQGDIVSALLALIGDVYPQKFAYAGVGAMDELAHRGAAGARRQGFSSARAITLVVLLMVFFGHGCGHDPLYPWIARTLADPAIADPLLRAERLEKRTLTWLAHVLENFDKDGQA